MRPSQEEGSVGLDRETPKPSYRDDTCTLESTRLTYHTSGHSSFHPTSKAELALHRTPGSVLRPPDVTPADTDNLWTLLP